VRLSWFLIDGAELKCANEAQKSYSRFILNCWLVLDGVDSGANHGSSSRYELDIVRVRQVPGRV